MKTAIYNKDFLNKFNKFNSRKMFSVKIIEPVFCFKKIIQRCASVFQSSCLTGLLLLFVLSSCQHKNKAPMESTQAYAFRLKPGQDLKQEIQKLVMW